MARRFANVSEEEIEEAFSYPSIWYIYPPLFTSPSGDSCIIYLIFVHCKKSTRAIG